MVDAQVSPVRTEMICRRDGRKDINAGRQLKHKERKKKNLKRPGTAGAEMKEY